MKNKLGLLVVHLVLIAVTIVCVFPWILMLRISLIAPGKFFEMPIDWFAPPTFQHFNNVLSGPFIKFFINSVILSLCSTVIVVTIGSLAAFAIARYNFKSKENLLFFILGTRMGPAVVFAIPLYLQMIKFSLIDTHIGMILLYTFANLAFTIWMMYSFFKDVPPEFEEAAMLDGLGNFAVFIRISVPISISGLIATAILVFSFTWNEFFFALIMTRNVAKTFPTQVPSFFGAFTIDWGSMFAVSLMGTVVPIIFGMSVRKYLARGFTMGTVQ